MKNGKTLRRSLTVQYVRMLIWAMRLHVSPWSHLITRTATTVRDAELQSVR